MIEYSFNFKNPLYSIKEIIFLCSKITILITLLRQTSPFSLLLRRFHSAFMIEGRRTMTYSYT